MVKATMTRAVTLSGPWLGRPVFLSLCTFRRWAAVSIEQGQAIAERAPQFTEMDISVKPEYNQPQMLVSSSMGYDRR